MPHAATMITRPMTLRSWLLAASCVFFNACVHQPTTTQTPQTPATIIPDLSRYDDETRQTMQLACAIERTDGPVAYGACLNRQIASLQGSPGIPSLGRYDDDTRQTMELACAIERTDGPVAYGACLNRQIASLQRAQGIPVTSGQHTSQTPIDVARSFFIALDQQRWMDAAAHADTDWALKFQLRDVAMIATSIQMSLRPDSGSAGSLVAIPEKTGGLQELIRPYASAKLEGLRGIQTLGDLAALTPLEYLARSFEGTYHMPSADQRDGPPTWEIVGAVDESDSLAYVLYRRGGATVWLHQPGEVEIMYFVRRNGSWQYRLSKDLTFPSLSSMIRGTEFNGRRVR